MELMTAALGRSLLTKLITELNHRIPRIKCYCYTDRSPVLDWIKTDPRKHSSFVANRIAAIQKQSADWEWGHCRSNQNPADHITRGLKYDELETNKLWWNGPNDLKSRIKIEKI
jgi:hypothetical protein